MVIRRRSAKGGRVTTRPFSAAVWMFLAALAVSAVIWATSAWLLGIAGHAKAGTDRANARLDAVRTGLAAGAGVGAAAGLLLSFRRQHHQEIATALTEHDATERRITELYTKAIEQLGNERPAVRLGGLYALERLAQDHPPHRQNIVEVICAYLRMPSHSEGTPVGHNPDEALAQPTPQRQRLNEELQVRAAAQRILTRHLRFPTSLPSREHPNDPNFWNQIDLDLTNADLVDWNFHGCRAGTVIFVGANFIGEAFFGDANFTGVAVFGGARFSGDAWFTDATFGGDTWFLDSSFNGQANFRGSSFTGHAHFDGTSFNDAFFDRASFNANASFRSVRVAGQTSIRGAIFNAHASFREGTFKKTFFGEASFAHDISFRSAFFGDTIFFSGSSVGGRVNLSGARVHDVNCPHTLPPMWKLSPKEDGSGLVTNTEKTV